MATTVHSSFRAVRNRLAAGLAAILLVVLGIALNGFWAFRTMRASAYEATTVGGNLNTISLEIQVHALEANRLIDLAVRGTADSQASIEEAVFEIEEMRPLAERAARIAQATEVKERFRSLNSAVDAFTGRANAYLGVVRAGAGPVARATAERGYTEAAEALRNGVDDATVAGRGAATESAMKVESTSRRASIIGGAVSAAAICTILILGFLISITLREYSRMGAELDIAQRLQRMMLPASEEIRAVRGLDISGSTEPAAEVGGDYFDVIPGEDGVICTIGDVTGHGLESGVVAIMAQTSLRTLHAAGITDSRQIFDVINRVVYDNTRRMNCDRNLTLCTLRCSGDRVAISGQHEEVLVVRADGSLERHDTLELGFPLGLEKNIARFVAEDEISLAAGDVLVVYTDGVTEAIDKSGTMFGVERLCEVVRENRGLPADRLRDAVLSRVRNFMAGVPALDDISLLVIKPV